MRQLVRLDSSHCFLKKIYIASEKLFDSGMADLVKCENGLDYAVDLISHTKEDHSNNETRPVPRSSNH